MLKLYVEAEDAAAIAAINDEINQLANAGFIAEAKVIMDKTQKKRRN